MFLIEACCFTLSKLNSLPINELGEVAYESGWWCQAKCEPQEGCTVIQPNPENRNHHQAPKHWETLWSYFTTTILTKCQQRRREPGDLGQPATQKQDLKLTKNLLLNVPECRYTSIEAWQKPECQIGMNEITTQTSACWLYFNLIMKLHLPTCNSKRLK